jgi:hypothetical protein
MSEGNKFVIRRSFEELWNKGNLSLADELSLAKMTINF